MRTPEEGEAADVLVVIGDEQNIARFMVMDGLDCVKDIQELSKVMIALYAKNSKRHLHRSNFMSTRFILDLGRAAFKMTHITHPVSCAVIAVDIDGTWCRSMKDQMALEECWNNEPLKEIYPTQAHTNNATKWIEMLLNVLRMIRDANGVPLAAVILKRLIPLLDNEDMDFSLQHSIISSS